MSTTRVKMRILKAGKVLKWGRRQAAVTGWIMETDKAVKPTRKPKTKYPNRGYGGYTIEELEKLSEKLGGSWLI